jgi:7,8-dihydroneopterin aldolase/epimerase/oxygenase
MTASDRLHIDGLRVQALIGVRDWERQVRQTLLLDLTIAVDAAEPARGDDLTRAVDYGAVARRVTEFIAESDYGLIETLAERVATLIRNDFAVPWVRVRVRKPGAVPNAEGVAIEIERGESTP